jgi:hypothetical protein
MYDHLSVDEIADSELQDLLYQPAADDPEIARDPQFGVQRHVAEIPPDDFLGDDHPPPPGRQLRKQPGIAPRNDQDMVNRGVDEPVD